MPPDQIRLQGKDVPFTRQSVPVKSLKLDPKNPRIQFLVGQRAETVSETELDELIWDKDAVHALSGSILQNGGVYESIIVQRSGEKFLVREGNCRTVACKRLLEQYPNDARFTNIPAMVFDGALAEEDLAVLLADMHVASKIRWDAYEQAKHVSDLSNLYGKSYDWLSNHLRLSKSKIQELLSAYRATNEFLTLYPAPENVKKFSLFHEVMKKKDLREIFQGDAQMKKKFHEWFLTGKIYDSKQVRSLAPILANTEALKALDKSGFDEANKVIMRNDPALESDLFHAVKNATEYLKDAPASEIQDLKAGNPQKLIMLRNLMRSIEDLATLAELKL